MTIPNDGTPLFGSRWIDLRPDIAAAISLTIKAGWDVACKQLRIKPDDYEVPITESVRDGMREALEALPWRKTMVILPGTESRSDPSRTTPNGCTDIPRILIEIYLRGENHDPHAIIECKRVAGEDRALCRKYVVDGVDRFRSGQYSRNHSNGFMAGYVIDGDVVSVIASIIKYLKDHVRTEELLRDSELVRAKWAWQSTHERATVGLPIWLHHAVLQFCFPN